MKPKLVCIDETFLNGASGHHLPLFGQYFDITNYDPTQVYGIETTFMYRYDESRDKASRHEGKSKFIADGVWESQFSCTDNFDQDTLGLINAGYTHNDRVLAVPKWFWFEEHFSQQDKKTLITDLPHTHDKSKSFLLQMGDAKQARIQLYDALKQKDLLKNSLHSFLEYGIGLEGNFPKAEYDTNNPPFPQRAYRPEWYNDTNFTVVVETMNGLIDGPDDCFITEKTMKPIMYGHPFIVLGDKGTYSALRSWGFHTFPELFDQSFDFEENLNKKIEIVCEQIAKYQHKDVENKIVDNFNRFWNTELVEQLMIEQMIEPMLEFISTK